MLIVPITMRVKGTQSEVVSRIYQEFLNWTGETTQLNCPYYVQSRGDFVRVHRRLALTGNPIRPTLSILIQSEELGTKITGAIRASSASTIAIVLWVVPMTLIILCLMIASVIPPSHGREGLWITLLIGFLMVGVPLVAYLQARKRAKREGLMIYRRLSQALREKRIETVGGVEGS